MINRKKLHPNIFLLIILLFCMCDDKVKEVQSEIINNIQNTKEIDGFGKNDLSCQSLPEYSFPHSPQEKDGWNHFTIDSIYKAKLYNFFSNFDVYIEVINPNGEKFHAVLSNLEDEFWYGKNKLALRYYVRNWFEKIMFFDLHEISFYMNDLNRLGFVDTKYYEQGDKGNLKDYMVHEFELKNFNNINYLRVRSNGLFTNGEWNTILNEGESTPKKLERIEKFYKSKPHDSKLQRWWKSKYKYKTDFLFKYYDVSTAKEINIYPYKGCKVYHWFTSDSTVYSSLINSCVSEETENYSYYHFKNDSILELSIEKSSFGKQNDPNMYCITLERVTDPILLEKLKQYEFLKHSIINF